MKNRIFINIHYMELGGAETSLLGLLESLDPSLFEVDLLVNDPRGPLMEHIPGWINILPSPPPYRMLERPMLEALRHACFSIVARRLFAKLTYLCYALRSKPSDTNAMLMHVDRWTTPALPNIEDNARVGVIPTRTDIYDEAYAFCGFPSIVLNKVCAKHKVAWIHTDYSAIDIDTVLESRLWSRYDEIACVSEDARQRFLMRFPELASKTTVRENVLPIQYIKRRASEPLPPADAVRRHQLRLLTIGRYCTAKRLDAIPCICKHLIDNGLDVEWQIIGYGGDDTYIRRAIDATQMQDHVSLLGKKENPYPYIAACDWYVQPSLYEGCSVTVREAQALSRPVIITAYPTASSQFTPSPTSHIVPLPVYDCAQQITDIIRNYPLINTRT